MRGEPCWEGSDAQNLLKQDVDNGLHLQLKPKQLRETRSEYKLFGVRKFQKHIDQELTSGKDFDEVTKSKRYKSLKLGNC